jgi:protein disulfide-isomerase
MSSDSSTGSAGRKAWRIFSGVGAAALAALAVYFTLAWLNRPAVWTDDYAAAVRQAKAENKKILLNFTGSDWCPNCWRLDAEVFSRPVFARYARDHYVLVTLDFPLKKTLPDDVTKQNEALQQKYAVEGMPTLVLLDPAENKLSEIVGYDGKGPEALLAHLDKDYPAGAM